jgi:hypothetical protein
VAAAAVIMHEDLMKVVRNVDHPIKMLPAGMFMQGCCVPADESFCP